MTQAELAKFLKTKTRTVVAWENEQNKIPQWVASTIEGEGLRLNPNLSLEVFMRAQEKASAKGMTVNEWIDDVITKAALLVGLAAIVYAML